ncbi:hypothetical protein NOR53_819 [gamma proteobacterium NOR5-3]|nr:hypothetical protein NOR53_819 [gamma proteobacterium NOR5-3]
MTAAVDRVDGYSASYGDLDSIVGFCDSLAHDAAVPQ